MKPVRHKSRKDNWLFSQKFQRQREERSQDTSEDEKGMVQIEFGLSENLEAYTFINSNGEVID